MIYRRLSMNVVEEKKKVRWNVLNALVIVALTIVVVGGAVYLVLQIGI